MISDSEIHYFGSLVRDHAPLMIAAAEGCFLFPAEVVCNYLKALKLLNNILPTNAFNEVLGRRLHALPFVRIGQCRYYDLSYLDADAEEKSERQCELDGYTSGALMDVAVDTLADLTPVPRRKRSSAVIFAAA